MFRSPSRRKFTAMKVEAMAVATRPTLGETRPAMMTLAHTSGPHVAPGGVGPQEMARARDPFMLSESTNVGVVPRDHRGEEPQGAVDRHHDGAQQSQAVGREAKQGRARGKLTPGAKPCIWSIVIEGRDRAERSPRRPTQVYGVGSPGDRPGVLRR